LTLTAASKPHLSLLGLLQVNAQIILLEGGTMIQKTLDILFLKGFVLKESGWLRE
jgi:hypothetical protein